MYIKNPYYSLAYRFFYLCMCGYGIFLHFYPSDSSQTTHMFSYFTVQCNIFCFIVFFILFSSSLLTIQYPNDKIKMYFTHLNGMALLSIIITFLTYHFVLNGSGFSMIENSADTILTAITSSSSIQIPLPTERDVYVHYLVPALTIIDWLLFEPKGQFKWFDPFLWLIPTLTYFFMTIIRCEIFSNDYPYSFLNLSSLGILKVLSIILLFAGISLFLGYMIVAFDLVLSKKRKKISHKDKTIF